MTTSTSPAIMYARIFGVVLTIAGIVGLVITTNQNVTGSLLGLDVNLTHNFVHLASGVLGLIAGFAVLTMARTYALVLGVVYTLLAIWGIAVGNGFDPLNLFVQINMADNILHLAIGGLGIGAWFASRELGRETI